MQPDRLSYVIKVENRFFTRPQRLLCPITSDTPFPVTSSTPPPSSPPERRSLCFQSKVNTAVLLTPSSQLPSTSIPSPTSTSTWLPSSLDMVRPSSTKSASNRWSKSTSPTERVQLLPPQISTTAYLTNPAILFGTIQYWIFVRQYTLGVIQHRIVFRPRCRPGGPVHCRMLLFLQASTASITCPPLGASARPLVIRPPCQLQLTPAVRQLTRLFYHYHHVAFPGCRWGSYLPRRPLLCFLWPPWLRHILRETPLRPHRPLWVLEVSSHISRGGPSRLVHRFLFTTVQ